MTKYVVYNFNDTIKIQHVTSEEDEAKIYEIICNNSNYDKFKLIGTINTERDNACKMAMAIFNIVLNDCFHTTIRIRNDSVLTDDDSAVASFVSYDDFSDIPIVNDKFKNFVKMFFNDCGFDVIEVCDLYIKFKVK
jgi:hypothetical protein